MKLSRVLIAVILVVIVVALLWRYAPGCRQKAISVYEEHGGWTEEAKRQDPVGFIEYAEKKLRDHLDEMAESRQSLAQVRARLAQETESVKAKATAAEELAKRFREAYRKAEAAASYPVEVEGRRYSREELMRQTQLILQQRADYGRIGQEMAQASVAAVQKEDQLLAQISSTKATLAMLPAQKEIARVEKLTSKTQAIWDSVSELIRRNEGVLGESPVRTVEELLDSRAKQASEAAGPQVDVQAFLEGTE